jgi:hypothetical protein
MADPSEKYADKVAPEHRMAMEAIGFAAQILTPQAEQLGKFLEAERTSHSSLHITDPTLYRDMINSKNFDLQIRMARAAMSFILEIQKIKEEAARP